MLIHILYSAPASVIAAVFCSLIVAGLLKGIIGVGMPIVALPLLSLFIEAFVIAPAEAERLAVAGVSPDDLRAWKVGDRVVLRTRFALISPEWLASQTGEGGVTVYSLPVTPVVLLSQDGVTISASLSEP